MTRADLAAALGTTEEQLSPEAERVWAEWEALPPLTPSVLLALRAAHPGPDPRAHMLTPPPGES